MTALPADEIVSDGPDFLAGGLLRSLGEQLRPRSSWSFIKTLLWSTLTFGIAPLMIWPNRLRSLIDDERQQFIHLAEWMRLRSGNPRAGQLVEAANRIRSNFVLLYAPMFIGGFVLTLLIAYAWQTSFPIRQLLDSTFQFGRTVPQLGAAKTNDLFTFWSVGLSIGFVLHWFQLLIHSANVRRTVRAFNSLAITEGLPPVREPRGVGLRPIWLAAALIMMTANAVWAIPMMLAGGMQRRYAAVIGPALRQAVADRLRDLLMVRRPVMRVSMPISLPRTCPNLTCRGPMSRIANFCPRCGTHVGPEIDELA